LGKNGCRWGGKRASIRETTDKRQLEPFEEER